MRQLLVVGVLVVTGADFCWGDTEPGDVSKGVDLAGLDGWDIVVADDAIDWPWALSATGHRPWSSI